MKALIPILIGLLVVGCGKKVDTKTCYWCKESIKAAALACRYCGKEPHEPIIIKNPSLERAIRKAAGKPTGKLIKADLEKVTVLENELIVQADLNTVAKFTQLKRLVLSERQIIDVSPLVKLTQLEELYLEDCGRHALGLGNGILEANERLNLNTLSNFTQLKKLDLDSNHITDVRPLIKLTGLTLLSLDFNKLTDVDPLTKLMNLELLHLGNNQLTDVTPLAKLTRLKQLFLTNNPDLTKAQIDELQKALPKCKIFSNPKK